MSVTVATYSAVKAAAEELLRQHADVTVQAVLEITGGSKGTVAKHVRQFREEYSAATRIAEAPPALIHELAEPLVKKIFAAARLEAAKDHAIDATKGRDVQSWLTKENDALQRREEELEGLVAQLLADKEARTARVNELESALDDAVVSIDKLQKKLDGAEQALVNETAAKDRAEASVADLRLSLARLPDLDKKLEMLLAKQS